MSYRSTPENRHFGTSFTSVGGVEAEISMSQNTKKDRKKSTSGTSISRLDGYALAIWFHLSADLDAMQDKGGCSLLVHLYGAFSAGRYE